MTQIAPIPAMKAVTLRLDDEVFVIEASNVREILDLVPITEVPNAPPFVDGLVNVRGTIVPLADLRVLFGMKRPPPDADTRIIVIEIELEGESAIAAILADKVHDVVDIEPAEFEAAPKVGMRWRPEYIRGIAKHNGEFVVIPDLARIFAVNQSYAELA